MTKLEIMKLKAELMAVQSARAQHEFRIEQCLDEIERIKEQINIQTQKEIELNQKLQENK